MARSIFAALIAASLAGCSQNDGLLSQAPIDSIEVAGDYQAVAACSYLALDAKEGAGLKKTDLPGVIRLTVDSGGVRYWSLTFSQARAKATRVDFTAVRTMWGAGLHAGGVLPVVRGCAAKAG